MDTKTLAAALCQQYQVQPTSGGVFSVVTPLRYDDGDHVVVFVREENSRYKADDNGEAAFRLMQEGVDFDSARLRQWLNSLPEIHGVAWDDDEENLASFAESPARLPEVVMRVAECSIQMQALAALRVDRVSGPDFKEQIVSVLREVSAETGIEAKYDVPVDQDQQLITDVYFLTETPLAVVAASTTNRLLEAQLMWANAKRIGDRLKVIAVVDDPAKIGIKNFTRANYFTDKTVAYQNLEAPFRTLVRDEVIAH